MKNIKKNFAVLAAAALVIFAVLFLAGLVSCVPEQSNEAPRIAATQINIFEVGASGAPVTITALVPLQIGDVRTLSAEVSPANATDKAVTWSSSDDNVVAIDATGKLTAQASGNATITASAGGAAATLSVSVAYNITDEASLRAMASNLAGYYVLQNDIPLTQQWTPLGSFTGTLDGAGYSVKNLEINVPSIVNNAAGFISENSGTIKNIGLELGSQGVRGGDFFGALVGINRGTVSGRVTTMNNGKVNGRGDTTGALVGRNYGTVIGYATVAVTAEGATATGGLVGQSNGGLVVGYATGAVTGAVAVGGLVGFASRSATVIGYATGAVAGTHSNVGRNVNHIGGLIGDFIGSIYGYARGAVSTDRTYTTNIGPAAGRGDAASAANLYYSGKSGESTVTGPTGVTANPFGNKVSVAAGESFGTTSSTFSNLTVPPIAQYWTIEGGKWPAINFPADTIFDSVRGDKQPIAP